jgi:hypothetical protein
MAWAGVAWSASDPTMNSNNYSVTESEVGGNGQFNSSSANYEINPNTDDGGSSLGESAVGNSSSTNYQSNAGFNTTAQPGLMLSVTSGAADLGLLSLGSANTATSTFYVRDYTSYGYTVQLVGSPPSSAGHSLTGITTGMCGQSYGCASVNGTEQFGVNLVANTSPVSVGSIPICQAAGFCYGVSGDNSTGTYGTNRPYTVDGRYRYVQGETVASGPKSSGETDYTITFMANQGNATPSGHYSGTIQVVATGTY